MIVIETAVPHAREIEVAVLGNDDPQASVPGEVVPSREFYDYEAKYLDSASELFIPAPLTDEQTAEFQRLACEAFRAVDAAGMSRVDFLMRRDTGEIFLNEVNTIPGMTPTSLVPMAAKAAGLSFEDVCERVATLAHERFEAEKRPAAPIGDPR